MYQTPQCVEALTEELLGLFKGHTSSMHVLELYSFNYWSFPKKIPKGFFFEKKGLIMFP